MTSFGSLSTYLLFFVVSFIFYLLFIFFFGGGGVPKHHWLFYLKFFTIRQCSMRECLLFLVRFLSFRTENLNLFFENFAWNLCLCFLLSFWGLWLRHYKFPRLYKGRTYCICLRSGRISVKTLNLCYPHVSHVLSVVLSTHPIVPERSWQILTLSICHLFHNTPPFPRE